MSKQARKPKKDKWAATGSQLVERLEERRLLSAAVPLVHPTIGSLTSVPTGYSPAELRELYRLDDVQFGTVVGDGAGQTIAIVVAYDHPGLVATTDPGFASSDLAVFDNQYGLPHPPSFTKLGQNGPYATPTSDWLLEAALDVQMAHAVAPQAEIVMVIAGSPDGKDMMEAVRRAVDETDASVISMSWGHPEDGAQRADYYFGSVDQPITFVAATGDAGSPGAAPSLSSHVLAVGGTTVSRTTTGLGELSGWAGSGGGISSWNEQPSWQTGTAVTSTQRTYPDVSAIADPAAGVSIYDSNSGGWRAVGGTSAAGPIWAGFLAIVNQGRELNGKRPLNGATETLPAIYAAPNNAFRDLLSGNNGFSATAGYDLVTGRGSLIADTLADALVSYSAPSHVMVGTVYEVLGGDSSGRDRFSRGLAGQTVYADLNDDHRLTQGEPFTVTGSGGSFELLGSFSDASIRVATSKGWATAYTGNGRGAAGFTSMVIGLRAPTPAGRPVSPTAQVDTTFGVDGRVTRPASFYHSVQTVALTDGWLTLEQRVTQTGSFLTILKFGLDGNLDTNFGAGGQRDVSVASLVLRGHSLCVSESGGITVFGTAGNPTVNNEPYAHSYLVTARLTPDGRMDESFGNAGVAVHEQGAALEVSGGWTSGASTYVVGNDGPSLSNRLAKVWRLRADGTIDTAFGNGGWDRIAPGAKMPVISVQAYTNGVIIVGRSTDGIYGGSAWIRRLSHEGAVDHSFGYAGQFQFAGSSYGSDIRVDSQGRILVSTTDLLRLVCRLTPNGLLDKTFGNSGWIQLPRADGVYTFAIDLLPDDSFVQLSSTFQGVVYASHYLPDGTLNTSFGNGGRLILHSSSDAIETAEGVMRLRNGNFIATTHGINGMSYWGITTGETTPPPPIATGSISGVTYNDNNANGIFDTGDVPISGKTVFLDANNNGTLDSGEKSTLSSANGSYTFGSLAAGTYYIRRIFPSGYTYSNAPINLTLAPGQLYTLANIGSVKAGTVVTPPDTNPPPPSDPLNASIAGVTYNDNNANGIFDTGDVLITGKTVFLDANNNGRLDSGEKSTTSNGSGAFSFTGLAAGAYSVRRVFPTGYTYSNTPINLTLAQSQALAGANIGSVPVGTVVTPPDTNPPPPPPPPAEYGSISGVLYDDTNANGVFDSGDSPISRVVYLDTNNNGKLDSNETSVTSASNGTFTFTNLAAGDYRVRREFPPGWKASNPIRDYTLTAGQIITGADIGSVKSSTTVTPPGENPPPPTGDTASISGFLFWDANRTAQFDSGDSYQGGKTVFIDLDDDNILDSNERRLTTDSQGRFTFDGLSAGTYIVKRVLPKGYATTTPEQAVTLTAGQLFAGVAIGTNAA